MLLSLRSVSLADPTGKVKCALQVLLADVIFMKAVFHFHRASCGKWPESSSQTSTGFHAALSCGIDPSQRF